MKALVNSLSIFRIVAAFAIIPAFLFQMHWTLFVLFSLAGISDFFDGYLAKKYKVVTKIGGVLDHIGDKLLVINSMIILAVVMRMWFVLIPIILMVSREIYVSGLREFLGSQKIEMPVDSKNGYFSMAKVKTFLQMVSVGAFFLLIALGSSITGPISGKALLYFLIALPYICIWGLWLSFAASWWSGGTYTYDFIKKIKKLK
ncbi:MAG: CDP-alcohol phosphatidyltransferase family protein [Alphaproteobacteria bacterium]|nr:CDP-alcohol phosphatidyltransferase family protein [Alphaproteobacteria bacterium]